MPFIPHTESDRDQMLAALDIPNIQSLFDEVPEGLLVDALRLEEGISEPELLRDMALRAEDNFRGPAFLGGGAYEHYIPSAVWDVATRGEFMTAYTPYQAEASQGTLQLVYEYQSMMTALTGMEVSNASLYDGASALAEAVLMAVRAGRRDSSRTVLVPRSLNPRYLRVVRSLVEAQGIRIALLDFDAATLQTPVEVLQGVSEPYCAMVLPLPNYFGQIEDVHVLTDIAQATGALVIAVVNPVAITLFAPPGEWGTRGADIAVGEGQPLGLPLASGGPYFGFMCCRQSLVRQMPGRIIGRTTDLEGKTGFALTLQAREQHIRRAKATSNICTNQGLAVTAATIYMAIMGGEGLSNVASACAAGAADLKRRLCELPGISAWTDTDGFHEFVLSLPLPAERCIAAMAERGILAGLPLSGDYEGLNNALLVCVTEVRTPDELDAYVACMKEVLKLEAAEC